MITVKYFGLIAEITNCAEESYNIDSISIDEFVYQLKIKHHLQNQLFSVAINQKIADSTQKIIIKSKDNIALLPPFAGG